MARILNASIDTTLGGDSASNEIISSQKAIKTYVDTKYNNLYYTTTCPAITPVSDIATWVVTHGLGSTNVVCSLYDSNGAEILKNTTIDSANQVTITFNANLDISAGDYKVVVLAGGAISSGNTPYWQISNKSYYSNATLSASGSPSEYTLDLSTYLPQDGVQYLLLCNTSLSSGNSMVDTDLGKNIAQIYNGLNNPLSFQLKLPVGAGRQIKLRVYSELTNFYFQANAYIKVG